MLVNIHIIVLSPHSSMPPVCWSCKSRKASVNIDSGCVWDTVNCLLTKRSWSEEGDFLVQRERIVWSEDSVTLKPSLLWNITNTYLDLFPLSLNTNTHDVSEVVRSAAVNGLTPLNTSIIANVECNIFFCS
jgi:hypothetical protein